MDLVTRQVNIYLNKVTGEFEPVTEDDLAIIEEAGDAADADDLPDWEKEDAVRVNAILNSGDYIQLPTSYDIFDYAIMENFCQSVEDERVRDTLLDRIRGSGAFRRFRDTISDFGIENDWYAFKRGVLKGMAIEWLESNGIAYQDDMNNPRKTG